jgi:hypothetical protein
MQAKPRTTTAAVTGTPIVRPSSRNHLPKFMPARDSRNRRIRGLYEHNALCYAQLSLDRAFAKKSAPLCLFHFRESCRASFAGCQGRFDNANAMFLHDFIVRLEIQFDRARAKYIGKQIR